MDDVDTENSRTINEDDENFPILFLFVIPPLFHIFLFNTPNPLILPDLCDDDQQFKLRKKPEQKPNPK